jgi:hypothetical protein
METAESRPVVLGVPDADALVAVAESPRQLASRRQFGYIAAPVTGA